MITLVKMSFQQNIVLKKMNNDFFADVVIIARGRRLAQADSYLTLF